LGFLVTFSLFSTKMEMLASASTFFSAVNHKNTKFYKNTLWDTTATIEQSTVRITDNFIFDVDFDFDCNQLRISPTEPHYLTFFQYPGGEHKHKQEQEQQQDQIQNLLSYIH